MYCSRIMWRPAPLPPRGETVDAHACEFRQIEARRMFSITSMVMPGRSAGTGQTSWPLYMVPIGVVISVVCVAKSSSVCSPPIPQGLDQSRRWRPCKTRRGRFCNRPSVGRARAA